MGWIITQWLVVRLNLFYGGILKWEPSRGESACVNRSNPRNPIWRQPPQVKHASSIYIHGAFCHFIFEFVNENNILNDFKLLKILFMNDINLSCDFNKERCVIVEWRSAIMCLIILWGVGKAGTLISRSIWRFRPGSFLCHFLMNDHLQIFKVI